MHECVHMVCVHLESPSNLVLILHGVGVTLWATALGFALPVLYIYVQFLSVSPATELVSMYVKAGS